LKLTWHKVYKQKGALKEMMFGNKKGESGSTMGPLIWLIVILVAAALVIFFIAGGFDKLSGLFKQAPETLEAVVTVCNTINTPATFCDQMRYVTLNGEAQYVNCYYPAIKDRLENTREVSCKIPTGSGIGGNVVTDTPEDWGKYFCAGLIKSKQWKAGVMSNGILCESLSCSDMGGKISVVNSCEDVNKKPYTKGFSESKDKSYCCL
jgi:hypothetical protein